MNRREFFQRVGAGSIGTGSASIGAIRQALARVAFLPQATPTDRAAHVINRLTFGVTPELYDYVRQIGAEAFIEEQLAPETIDDSETDRLLGAFPLINESGGQLFQEDDQERRRVLIELIGATIIRSIYSRRQLYERMVSFWSDHFHVYIGEQIVAFLKLDDDRDVIRPHALTTFRELLGASAHSPAMLIYLDNAGSRAEAPNENYARELLELHTLGVNGGYTEDDVKAAARAFTGWSVSRANEGQVGAFRFRRRAHDPNAKSVLGIALPTGRDMEDGEALLDVLAAHPSTAQFVATKLVRRFVADDPPTSLVERTATTFTQTNGDIRAVLRTIFYSDEFGNAPPRFKRPYEYSVSLLRALATPDRRTQGIVRNLFDTLRTMGHVPFSWPAPNGYPDMGAYWMNSLLTRWNLTISLLENGLLDPATLNAFLNAHTTDDQTLAFVGQYLFNRALTAEEIRIIEEFSAAHPDADTRPLAILSLLLCAPGFQYF